MHVVRVELRLQVFALGASGDSWMQFRVGDHWHNSDVQMFLLRTWSKIEWMLIRLKSENGSESLGDSSSLPARDRQMILGSSDSDALMIG